MRMRQAAGSPGVADAVLLGAHPAQDDRVHPLEVARVEGQRQVHVMLVGALAEHAIDGVAEVIFDVAAAV